MASKVHIRGDRALLGTRPFPGAKPRKNKAVRAEAQSGQYCAMMGRVLTDGIRAGPQPEVCHQEGPFDGDVEPREGWMEAIRSHPTSPGEGKVKVHIRGDRALLGTRPFPGAKPRKNKAVRAEAQSGQYCAMMGRVLTDGIRAGPQPEVCHQEGPFDGDVEPREGWMEAIRSHPTSPGEGKVKVHIRGDRALLGTRPFPGAKPRKNKAVRAEAQSGQYCAMMGRTSPYPTRPIPELVSTSSYSLAH
ncbi:hypothetical protein F0562_017883 [Nyssa sinensis]|uniref:Uncharacterized protein n=1 Tax=Nyssa sinensis TaxID=561372 RepID=A0A5J4ZAE7_9ASTE|nr:hypothetical protein F0562_017883 [Nyssa sinensis]